VKYSLLYILLLFLFLFSCQERKKEKLLDDKFVPHPLMERIDHYTDSLFTEDFFQSNHYSYSVNLLKDSTRYFHTTETVIIDDTLQYSLKVCEAITQNDSLVLKLEALPDSINQPYQLTLFKKGNQNSSKLELTYGVTDTSWREPVFTTFYQSIFFDKVKYSKGDSLKAKISLLISGHHTAFETNFTDTLKIYGLIKAVVK
jgi:hypothetical protein